jgi:hypothetical protein
MQPLALLSRFPEMDMHTAKVIVGRGMLGDEFGHRDRAGLKAL